MTLPSINAQRIRFYPDRKPTNPRIKKAPFALMGALLLFAYLDIP